MSFPRYPKYKDSGLTWLGIVPEHWRVLPLKRVVSHNDDVLDESTPADTDILYVDVSAVDTTRGIHTKEPMKFATAPSRARRRVKHDDVIVSTVRTYLRAIARVCEPEENLVVSTGFAVLRSRGELLGDYLGYALAGSEFIDQVIARSTGVSYPAINASELVAIPIAVPPRCEQLHITAFLDAETTKIDALILEQQRLIALLEEKRQAVIAHAVTKGLNPDVPMKPSGVEWLGDIPAHWEVRRLKSLLSDVKAGPFGSTLTKDMYVREGYRVYGQEQVIPGEFSIGDYHIPAALYDELEQYAVRPGDLLISCVGTFGKVAVVPPDVAPGIINPRLIRLRCSTGVLAGYLADVMRSRVVFAQMEMLSRGGTMDVINIGTLRDLVVALPPLEEQSLILDWIHDQRAHLNDLAGEAERGITLLAERRAALIAAAVTGKIDVRNYATDQADAA